MKVTKIAKIRGKLAKALKMIDDVICQCYEIESAPIVKEKTAKKVVKKLAKKRGKK